MRKERSEQAGLSLKPADLVLTTSAFTGAVALLVVFPWAPAAAHSISVFGVIALGVLVLRGLERRIRHGWLSTLAAFWLLPSAVFGHGFLGPLADTVRPVLADRSLALLDLRLFGVHPSVWLEGRLPPWLVEVLMGCYYTYFLWPLLLGIVLYRRADRRAFDRYVLALSLLYATNFVFYMLVPAVGPRYFLWDHFRGPLEGLWLTPLLESAMRTPTFTRDCFPSGHTAVTLTVLLFAFWHSKRFFLFMLPFAVGLISATLAGRFHYAIDLIAALPMVLVCVSTAVAVYRQQAPALVLVPSAGFSARRWSSSLRSLSRSSNRRSTARA